MVNGQLELDEIYSAYTSERKRRVRRIKANLDRVEAWKKSLTRLTDASIESSVKERLATAFKLAQDNDIVFTTVKTTTRPYYYRHDMECTYHKGDVKFNAIGTHRIDAKGNVTLEFFRKTEKSWNPRGARIMRITAGITNRVTNNVLQAMLTTESD